MKMNTQGLDKLISEMQKLGEHSGKMAEAMVNAAAVEIRNAWKESAEQHELIDTGAMIESIGFPGPVGNMNGTLYRDVYPQGKDGKGTRNAEKAFVLNYGTSRIKPTHWVDEAEAKAEPTIQRKLEEMWGEYLDTGKIPPVPDTGGSSAGGINTIIK